MKNFLRNFNWYQAICVTLIILAIILVIVGVGLFLDAKFIQGCICLAVMLVCIFFVAGMTD